MREEAARIGRALVQTVEQNKLVFRRQLYIVTQFQLTVFHVVFFHPHKRGVQQSVYIDFLDSPSLINLIEVIPHIRKR